MRTLLCFLHFEDLNRSIILYNNIFVHLFFLYHNLHFMIINLCINAFVYLSLKKYKQTNNPSLTCHPPAPSLSLAFPLEPNFLKEKSTVGISTSLLPFSIYPSLTSSSPFQETVLVIVTKDFLAAKFNGPHCSPYLP